MVGTGIQSEKGGIVAKTANDQLAMYDEWEELADDNGEVITFDAGTTHEGQFIRRATVTLPEDQRTNNKGEYQETADLLVFGRDDQTKWSVWVGYQLDRVNWQEGEYYRVACTGTRKAQQGNVKIFSVKRRVRKQEEPF